MVSFKESEHNIKLFTTKVQYHDAVYSRALRQS